MLWLVPVKRKNSAQAKMKPERIQGDPPVRKVPALTSCFYYIWSCVNCQLEMNQHITGKITANKCKKAAPGVQERHTGLGKEAHGNMGRFH